MLMLMLVNSLHMKYVGTSLYRLGFCGASLFVIAVEAELVHVAQTARSDLHKPLARLPFLLTCSPTTSQTTHSHGRFRASARPSTAEGQ